MALQSGRINGVVKKDSSGTISTDYDFWLNWTVNSQNESNLTSNVTLSLNLQRNDGYAGSAYSFVTYENALSLTVNGTNYIHTIINIDTRNSIIDNLLTKTIDIKHNNDGTLKLNVNAFFTIDVPNLQGGTCSSAVGGIPIITIPTTPTAPTSVLAYQDSGDYINYTRGIVTISWSGATGNITKYNIYRRATGQNDETFDSYVLIGNTTTNTFSDPAPSEFMAGKRIEYGIVAFNGDYNAPVATSNSLEVRGAIKINTGTWKTGTVWINIGGTWKRSKSVWINISGTWKRSI